MNIHFCGKREHLEGFEDAKRRCCFWISRGGWKEAVTKELNVMAGGICAVTEVQANAMYTVRVNDNEIIVECAMGSRTSVVDELDTHT
jgi:hypothetical protein